MTTFSLSQFVASYLPIAMSVVGTIAVALGGLSAFRSKREVTLREVTSTWRELAESRQAKILSLEAEILRIEADLHTTRRHEMYLWEQIRLRDGSAVHAPAPEEGPG